MIKKNILIIFFKKNFMVIQQIWDQKTLKNASRDYLEKD